MTIDEPTVQQLLIQRQPTTRTIPQRGRAHIDDDQWEFLSGEAGSLVWTPRFDYEFRRGRNFQALFPQGRPPRSTSVPLGSLRLWAQPGYEPCCDVCCEFGKHQQRNACPACKGEGAHYCAACEASHECSKCDGYGGDFTLTPCTSCQGESVTKHWGQVRGTAAIPLRILRVLLQPILTPDDTKVQCFVQNRTFVIVGPDWRMGIPIRLKTEEPPSLYAPLPSDVILHVLPGFES